MDIFCTIFLKSSKATQNLIFLKKKLLTVWDAFTLAPIKLDFREKVGAKMKDDLPREELRKYTVRNH